MIQWFLKLIMATIGWGYVLIERFVKYPDEPEILDVPIDEDFMKMSRMELCDHIGTKFGLPKGAFWNLQSTQKIRLGCQLARDFREHHRGSSEKGNE